MHHNKEKSEIDISQNVLICFHHGTALCPARRQWLKYVNFISFRLEQATDPSLESEDWALNMEICDLINESSSDANSKDAMKAIRKRLTQYIGKNYTVIL